MVQAMDTQIGRVMQALDVNDLAPNTIVIFTSDNGGERFSDTWPFTGVKIDAPPPTRGGRVSAGQPIGLLAAAGLALRPRAA